MSVVLLSGGSGGAKLARGLYGIIGDELAVIANTGDDIEIYGAHVSPDPDLVTYWLADRIDDRGWGLAEDTFHVMDGLRDLGVDVWFNLGDRDLAVCLERSRRLADRDTLSDALAGLTAAFGVTARVLPMSDDPVRTRILAGGQWLGLQEFLIGAGGDGPVEDVAFDGAALAAPAPAALEAIAAADTIIVGPSNPVISIGPILSLPGMRDAIHLADAPVIGVSPVVGGAILKGPTAACLAWAGQPCDATGVVAWYGGLLDGIVADEPVPDIPAMQMDTLLDTPDRRRAAAAQILAFGQSVARAD